MTKARFLCILIMILAVKISALPRVAYIGMSAALPGSGELALGKSARGMTLLTFDLISLSAFLGTQTQVDDLTKSFKQYALTHAGVPINTDERYYQHIQQYISSKEFNRFQMLMARNYFLIYQYNPDGYSEYIAANTYGEDESWNWDSDEQFRKYRKLRTNRQKAKMYNNLSLGILLLNRAVSVIDTAILSANPNKASNVYFSPHGEDGIMINCKIDF
ncbi:MAG: hypothetical protein Q8M98_11790 [Candidatus Cloacimonadaceae bacterium]|nr:hypothetical protein [Candidatus Cloacimonadaceae bacterium]